MFKSNKEHKFTNYNCDVGNCVLLNSRDVDESVLNDLPDSSSTYLMLYKANGLKPLQAGSTYSVKDGISKGGTNKSYATVPLDPWWYNNEPYEGFSSRAAQILTHELINTIVSRAEVAPLNCKSIAANNGAGNATKNELVRLKAFDQDCYKRICEQGQKLGFYPQTGKPSPGAGLVHTSEEATR